MKAYEVAAAFGYENLKRVDRPSPEPGPLEVCIDVRACSLNFRDHLMISGAYNPRQPLPLVPLSDGVGEVSAVGPGVTRVEVGDRVAGCFAQDWIGGRPLTERLRSTLGGPRGGMLAEQVCLPEHGVVKVPAYLSDAEAATLPCAALTAYNALTKFAPVTAGQRVLLLGTGGVSTFGLQFARALGAEVFVTSSSDDKLERARALGAHHGINYAKDEGWGRTVRKLTDGVGVDCVLEVGGEGTLAQSLRAVRAGGLIALIGVLSGGGPKADLTSAFMNGVALQGILVGSRDDFEAMNRALEVSRLKPVVDREFGFDEVHAAFEHLKRGAHQGKVVIQVG